MKKNNWIKYLFLLAGFMYFSSASAALLSFSPQSQTVNVGDSFGVDIVISALNAADGSREIVSAFDLDVLYDSTVLNATGVSFGALLGDESFFEAFTDSILSPGRSDFSELSLLFDSDLLALQSDDNFTLATLSFDAIAEGVSSLTFDPAAFPGIDVKGLNAERLDVSTEQGAITVTVPEPGIFFLMISGLFSLVIASRKNNC